MQLVEPLTLCPDCLVIRTPRSRHCSVCNQCVERYDHHCPWINNCVGAKNHSFFMCFVSSVIFSLSFVFFYTGYGLSRIYAQEEIQRKDLFYNILPDIFTLDKNSYIVASYMVMVLTGFFLLPVGLLYYI